MSESRGSTGSTMAYSVPWRSFLPGDVLYGLDKLQRPEVGFPEGYPGVPIEYGDPYPNIATLIPSLGGTPVHNTNSPRISLGFPLDFLPSTPRRRETTWSSFCLRKQHECTERTGTEL